MIHQQLMQDMIVMALSTDADGDGVLMNLK